MPNTKKYVSLDKLGLYDEKIKKFLGDADAVVLQGAKDYADGLAVNYEKSGAAATAEANAKAYADGKDAAIQAAHKAGTDAAAAAAVADGKAVAAQGEVDALETYVGVIPEGATATNVVAYVQEKTAGIATEGAMTELSGRVTTVEGKVANIEKDYLKAADKTELEGAIEDVQGAVDAEAGRAAGIEAGLRTDVDAIKGDYLKATDKAELQGNIDTVSGAVERLTNGVSAEEIDGVNDLIQYVNEHGAVVTGMQEDIAENAEAIAAIMEEFESLAGEMDGLEGAVATKAEKTYVDEQVQALQGVDTGLGNRITALESKFGGAEGSVEDQIADAKQEAIDAAASAADTKDAEILRQAKAYADDEDAKVEARVATLETASATHALASDLTALDGRVEVVEGKVGTLESKMTAVEGKASANETAIGELQTAVAGKAAQADLEAIGARVTTLETWHNNFTECSEDEINGLFA